MSRCAFAVRQSALTCLGLAWPVTPVTVSHAPHIRARSQRSELNAWTRRMSMPSATLVVESCRRSAVLETRDLA
jgi:hypothetical protein